jgi:hypothetical protein
MPSKLTRLLQGWRIKGASPAVTTFDTEASRRVRRPQPACRSRRDRCAHEEDSARCRKLSVALRTARKAPASMTCIPRDLDLILPVSLTSSSLLMLNKFKMRGLLPLRVPICKGGLLGRQTGSFGSG